MELAGGLSSAYLPKRQRRARTNERGSGAECPAPHARSCPNEPSRGRHGPELASGRQRRATRSCGPRTELRRAMAPGHGSESKVHLCHRVERMNCGSFTQWNKYTDAGCFFPGGLFVDEYDHEYSRDCEPMKGGHADNYYYQLASW